jgi:hypothetical protein
MQLPDNNGICVTLIGQDGDRRNVPVAIGFIHKETGDNFALFLAHCVAAGLRLSDRAVFTDRGKQLNAQQILCRAGIKVNLKFCCMHLSFNVNDRFGLNDADKERAKALIYKLQAVTTVFSMKVFSLRCERRFQAY